MAVMLELSEKATLIRMLQQAIINTLETNEKTEDISKEREGIIKKHVEILELKSTISEKKTHWLGLISEWKEKGKESVNYKILIEE